MPKDNWPTPRIKPSDSFTGGTKDRWYLNACIGPQLSDSRALSAYTDGFRSAGRKLVDTFIEQGNTIDYLLDTVVYPVVFLYRHHFELLLKSLVEECNIVEHGKWGIPKPSAISRASTGYSVAIICSTSSIRDALISCMLPTLVCSTARPSAPNSPLTGSVFRYTREFKISRSI